MKERIALRIFIGQLFFLSIFYQLFDTIIMQNMFLTSLMWMIFFQIFVKSRSTETLIILNFRLEVDTESILKWCT